MEERTVVGNQLTLHSGRAKATSILMAGSRGNTASVCQAAVVISSAAAPALTLLVSGGVRHGLSAPDAPLTCHGASLAPCIAVHLHISHIS